MFGRALIESSRAPATSKLRMRVKFNPFFAQYTWCVCLCVPVVSLSLVSWLASKARGVMAEATSEQPYDLTSVIGGYLDRHLVFPMLEFLSEKKVGSFTSPSPSLSLFPSLSLSLSLPPSPLSLSLFLSPSLPPSLSSAQYMFLCGFVD